MGHVSSRWLPRIENRIRHAQEDLFSGNWRKSKSQTNLTFEISPKLYLWTVGDRCVVNLVCYFRKTYNMFIANILMATQIDTEWGRISKPYLSHPPSFRDAHLWAVPHYFSPLPPFYSPCISLSFCFESPGRKRGVGQISGIHQSLSSDVISIPSIPEDADKEEGWVGCGKGGRNAGEEKWPTDMSFFLESDAGDSGAEHKFDKFVCDKNGTFFVIIIIFFSSFPLFTRFSLFSELRRPRFLFVLFSVLACNFSPSQRSCIFIINK